MFEALKGIVGSNESDDSVDNFETFLEQVIKGSGTEKSRDFQNLCDELRKLFGDGTLTSGMSNANKHLELNSLHSAIGQVNTYANNLKPSRFSSAPVAQAIAAGVQSGAYAFLAELQTKEYTSYYDKKTNQNADWSKVSGRSEDEKLCAKIFLGCLPLFYQAFTYIYWRCDSKGSGTWETQTFDGSKGHHLKYFMFAMNYEASYLNNRRGSEVLSGAIKAFADFNEGMTEAQSKAKKRTQAVSAARRELYPSVSSQTSNANKPTYLEFLTELSKKFPETLSASTPAKDSLAALYYCALCYFKCHQQKNVTKAVNTPTTIREMLYYLAALQFSPNYEHFDNYITDHFKKLSKSESDEVYDAALMIPVADSGISTEATVKYGGNR
ncbi:variant erythrocyte surface antigen-1 family protein [Babesia caballi]|uniref:Variant erythrocyte surface antigen-1 family protein n=1 Tax=Babesia caballi TaxID=5871 RepID=A0AAV4LUM1_BABCB|nr:variant erythrocyte surface antigen-1 family protein [Babesia caballi]